MENTRLSVKDILTEKEVMDLLGLKLPQLSNLRRNKQFPYVQAGKSRLYIDSSVAKWCSEHETVLNRQG